MECCVQNGDNNNSSGKQQFNVVIDVTSGKCPAGELRGEKNIREGAIPVLSCEGACIRGEIARNVANILSKKEGYSRGCHGEFLTVPDSAIAQWIKTANKVVVVDGCFLRCHTRIFKNILDESKLTVFDALSYYRKYTEYFDPSAIPESELKEVATEVAKKILIDLQNKVENGNIDAATCIS